MRTIAFIGTGNMAGAMIDGIMTKGVIQPDEIVLYNRTPVKAEVYAAKYKGILVAESEKEAAKQAKYIVLGVKPYQHQEVIEKIKADMSPEQVVITIAAGLSIEGIRYWFGDDVKVARTMPNTPVKVMAGMTAVTFSDRLETSEKQWVLALLNSFGLVEVIDEKLMDSVPAISGSAPAYMFQLIEAMADEGVRQGFQRDQSYKMAAQAMYGAGKMVLETGLHPAVLKDQVTSPGGTTIEALKVLEENGFRAAIMRAMDACTQKTQQLANKK